MKFSSLERVLLKANADINVVDNDGNSALSIAKEYGYEELQKILIEAGAKEG